MTKDVLESDKNAVKLTIITINYNNNEGLIKTIESIINQTWTDFEFIIIDGGSTDDSLSTLNKYDKYINYWVSEKDKGIYDAMNKAIQIAKGKYLNFMNSGDFFYTNTILEEIKSNFSNNVGVLYGDAMFFCDEWDDKLIKMPSTLTFTHFLTDGLCHQASFIKRDLFFKHFFYSLEYKIVSDWGFFVYVLCKKNESYQHLEKIICYYDYSGISSVPENIPPGLLERKVFLKKHFPLFYDDFTCDVNRTFDRRMQKVIKIKDSRFLWKILKYWTSIFLFVLPKQKENDWS
ncbi:glycosyltransferase family 2 protein [Flavobacterium ovatum]|uniref:glycosyltransferase family 2 protein n=1 Tax=Flavobacterium ovatum TaxID=1928857 RepID=UPI00344C231B